MTSLATSLPVAQWLERLTGVREVMGSFPIGDSDFFFVPRSWQTEYSILLKILLNSNSRKEDSEFLTQETVQCYKEEHFTTKLWFKHNLE